MFVWCSSECSLCPKAKYNLVWWAFSPEFAVWKCLQHVGTLSPQSHLLSKAFQLQIAYYKQSECTLWVNNEPKEIYLPKTNFSTQYKHCLWNSNCIPNNFHIYFFSILNIKLHWRFLFRIVLSEARIKRWMPCCYTNTIISESIM